jgi:hypothetical protein
MLVKAMKSINKAYTILRNIESEADLKKAKLSLSDYYAAKDIFKELTTPGSSATTFYSNVAAFYERCDFLVVPKQGHFIIWTEAN